MSDILLPHPHHCKKLSKNFQAELGNIPHFTAISLLFQELTDLSTIRLFWLLAHQEVCVVNAAAVLQIPQEEAASHLHSLYEKGLIRCRIDGREVLYSAQDTPLAHHLHELMEQIMDIPCPEKAVDYDATTEEIIHKVHAYLTENLDSRITIEELSKMFLMNTTTLKTEFKKVYGTSIAAHMKQHRMKKAAQLLTQTRDDISSIARAVGYESQSRFSAAFKEVFGVLPTEYRKDRTTCPSQDDGCCK